MAANRTKDKNGKKARFAFALDAQLHERLRQAAQEARRTMTGQIVHILETHFQQTSARENERKQ